MVRDDEIRRFLRDDHPGTHLIEAAGDAYAIHDPDRDLPPERQLPWATVVTSDAHDTASDLNRPGVFRLNLGLPRAVHDGLALTDGSDLTALDVLHPHPVYGATSWVCVLNPDRTWPRVRELAGEAYAFAVRKHGNAARRRA